MRFITRWFGTAIAVFVVLWLLPGITLIGGAYLAPILTALILSLLNVTVKPILQILGIPLTIITFGVGYIFINALVLLLASELTTSLFGQGILIDSFGTALLASIIISIVSSLTTPQV